MCQSSGESIEHILLPCTVARDIWLFVFTLFGVPWGFAKDGGSDAKLLE